MFTFMFDNKLLTQFRGIYKGAHRNFRDFIRTARHFKGK